MRAVLALCLVVLLLSACSSLVPGGFGSGGIGNNVYSTDIEQESEAQETYTGVLCRDNALPLVAGGSAPRCDYAVMRPPQWDVFVNAGLYDIDRRCDGYLEWLREMKQERGPIGSQLAKTGTLAGALLHATGAGDLAINLTALAFNYAADTFTNFDPSLIFGVESSTIQSLVLKRQYDAKKQLADVTIANKPQAMQALRGYLRVCMPFTITTDINTTLATNARTGEAPASGPVQVDAVAIGALTANAPVVAEPPAAPYDREAPKLFVNPIAKYHLDIVKLQKKLCDSSPNGVVGTGTRSAVWALEEMPIAGVVRDGKLNDQEEDALLAMPNCDATLYENPYERIQFSDPRTFVPLVKLLNRAETQTASLTEDIAYTDPRFDRMTFRDKVKAFRKTVPDAESTVVLDDQLTANLKRRLLNPQ